MVWVAYRCKALNSAASKLGLIRTSAQYAGRGREWRTPPEVFLPLDREFGFTLDPCCTTESALCATYFTEVNDGLNCPWDGHRVFMNPPYGREIYAWTKKATTEVAAGRCPVVVGLLPSATELSWWHEDVIARKAELRWIRARVNFIREDGLRTHAFQPSVIVIWRSLPSPQGLNDV